MLGYFNYVYGANPSVSPTFSSPSQTQNKTGIPFPHWKHPFSPNSAKNTKILTTLRPRSSTAHVEHTVMRLHPLFKTNCHTFMVTFLVVQNVSLHFHPIKGFLLDNPPPIHWEISMQIDPVTLPSPHGTKIILVVHHPSLRIFFILMTFLLKNVLHFREK